MSLSNIFADTNQNAHDTILYLQKKYGSSYISAMKKLNSDLKFDKDGFPTLDSRLLQLTDMEKEAIMFLVPGSIYRYREDFQDAYKEVQNADGSYTTKKIR